MDELRACKRGLVVASVALTAALAAEATLVALAVLAAPFVF